MMLLLNEFMNMNVDITVDAFISIYAITSWIIELVANIQAGWDYYCEASDEPSFV